MSLELSEREIYYMISNRELAGVRHGKESLSTWATSSTGSQRTLKFVLLRVPEMRAFSTLDW